MKFSDKQLKYSIRKFSIGVASVAIGAVYLSMGAHVAHAGEITPSSELQTGANGTGKPISNSSETETKTVIRTIKYVNASDESKEVSTTVTQTVTLERKKGTEEWTTGKWAEQPSPTVEGYNAPDKLTVEEKDVTASTENEEVLVYYSSSSATTTSTRGRRMRRALEDGTTDEPSSETTGKNADSTTPNADLGRKGNIALPDQPGVIVPEKDQEGGNDPNANLEFDKIKDDATTEELWNIINKMPDDFQNNERSYLRNMNTLGDDLRFKEGKVSTDGTGDKLQDGEIRELDSFGGWTAIAGKDGTPGKFVIGKKNADGYFTGWYVNEKGERVQGGMLGADALDNIYVHEQALDRRFKYMLMLVKGRTRANRNETVSDKTEYDPRSQNERAGKNSTDFKNLPFLVKDEYNKYSPGVVGYNGIEKTFKAFSSQFGSRVRVEFVTGYISDINGSKGSYRIVVNAKKKDGTITKVYDQTINRVAEIVQNEELYKKGLNVELAHERVLSLFKDEFHKRVNSFLNPKIQNSPLKKINKSKYDSEQKKLYDQFEAEATEEAKKQGDIVLNVDPELMSASKTNSEWKKTFTAWTIPKLSNELNNLLKFADKDTPNTPTWLKSGDDLAKADDRAYRLLTTLIPGAKKITYHVNEDQLEVETEHYTYIAARNGSKEAGIQGSEVAATLSAKTYGADESTFDNVNTNTKANERNNGWARSGSEEFKNFSHFVGVDKGIVRDKVITDEELTKKIKEKIGEGDSNLGKGGYFSTGDILLEKDVVSYTVQVFSADNNRVGVNPQSHRVQYNLPILADFSVIQNTVKPAIEVAKKIVPKLNIPEEDKKKITEEIEKKKKTSEIAELISGSVKVRYVDENGKSLSLKNDAGIGEKESDGTYITNKRQLIGTAYDVRNKKLNSLTTTDGTYYTFKEAATDSADLTGDIVRKGRTVTLVYRESEAPAAKGDVTVKYENENGDSLQADNELKKQAATGDSYDTKTVKPEKITKDGKIYKYKSLKEGSGAEVGTVGETAVVVTYVYELVKGDVTVKYENEDGEPIAEANELKKDVETGTDYNAAEVKKDRIEKDGKVYKYKSIKAGSAAETGKVSDTEAVITYVYALQNGNVTVKYENEAGEPIAEANELKKDVETGTDYNAAEVKKDRIEKDGKVYKYKSIKAGSAAETGKVSDGETVITYVYELVKTPDNPTPESPDKPNPDNPTPESPDTPEPDKPDKPDNLMPETPDSNRPEEPNNPEPDTPTSVSTTKVELPNTGTVTNGFFTAEVAAILAGLGILIPGIKKKETEE